MIPKGHSTSPFSSHSWSLNALFVDVSFPCAQSTVKIVGSGAGTGVTGEDAVGCKGKLRDAGLTTLLEKRTIETFQMLKGFNWVKRKEWFSHRGGRKADAIDPKHRCRG